MTRNKMTIAIALFLMFAMAFSLIALPTANAHSPAWQIPTYAYISVSPTPVGVNQQVLVVFWLDKVFSPETGVTNDYRFHNYELTITDPDGITTKQTFDYIADTTSSQYTTYTPTKVGTYTFNFTFPGQAFTQYDYDPTSELVNDTYLPSTAATHLTVQQEPVPTAPSYPLPTEYWTRPIEGQNTNWYTVASNWLGGYDPSGYGGTAMATYNVQPDGSAPNSAHIMWSKVLEFGGVVGGNTSLSVNGQMYYAGDSYEERFAYPLIIQGRLFYPLPRSDSNTGGGYVSVDLRTGEQYWFQKYANNPMFGQLLDFNSPNQHGVVMNGYLWAAEPYGTTLMAFDPINGNSLFNITNVPYPPYTMDSESYSPQMFGPNGEILIYQLDATNKWLALWNSTAAIAGGRISSSAYRPVGKVIDGSNPSAYSWNVTLPQTIPASSFVIRAIPGDILLASTPTVAPTNPYGIWSSWGTQPYTAWAVSLNPNSAGQLLWLENYSPPSGNITRFFGPVDTVNRVFTMADKETMQLSGYNLDTGKLMWGPVGNPLTSFQYYSADVTAYNMGAFSTAYGNLYVAGFGGLVYAYDTKTGSLLWTYGNGDAGNSTNDGLTSVWPYRPTFISNIADGKIYLFNQEHSPNTPYYKDAKIRCLNATTGKELWSIFGWASSGPQFYSQAGVIADGYLAFFNSYDGQVYCIGKGPSRTTVDAPMTGVTAGDTMIIRGTVTDIAAGTTQKEQAARFPNGVPAMSDESMSEWMEYVYMQKPRPANATGVTVTIDAIDPNNNFIHIGTTTSDASGTFGLAWLPPNIPGKYNIIATFAGSESYYGSYAETYAFIKETPAATPAPTPPPASIADIYILPGIIGIIVAIAVVGIIIILMLRKR
jgi:hypothetical protein